VRRVAAEAWLCPAQFSPAGPARAGLRRKLRRAGLAGVSITAVTGPLPQAEMARVAAQWTAAHGGERGFSMGRWCPQYVAGQRVFLARHEGRVIAFVTLHDGLDEWTLDLLRSLPGCPDGTMYALLAAAIDAARAAGIPRLSLATVSRAQHGRRAGYRADGGLARFKTAFAPRWEPLYLCAPAWWALGIVAADIARAVFRPAPLASPQRAAHFAPIEIAPAAAAWHSFAEGPLVGRAAPLHQEL
jgi:phosphatidylglycerol lysyltransferase